MPFDSTSYSVSCASLLQDLHKPPLPAFGDAPHLVQTAFSVASLVTVSGFVSAVSDTDSSSFLGAASFFLHKRENNLMPSYTGRYKRGKSARADTASCRSCLSGYMPNLLSRWQLKRLNFELIQTRRGEHIFQSSRLFYYIHKIQQNRRSARQLMPFP